MQKTVFKTAFTDTLPVLMGYLTMGMAAGILLAGTIHRSDVPLWAFLTSAGSISGALQFLMVGWMKNATPMLDVAILTICLNLRYAMYGFPLIDVFRNVPLRRKLYLIWTLTDETFALEVAAANTPAKNSISYRFAVAALDHGYWIVGVVAGALIGGGLPFDCRGIEFAMTALFLVILTDQCRISGNRIPALIGGGAALLSRMIFPTEKMLIPAMMLMLTGFFLLRSRLDHPSSEKKREEEASK